MIVAGFGFRSAATVQSLANAYAKARGPHRPDRITTASDKVDTQVFQDLAADLALPITKIDPEALREVRTATCSSHSLNARGAGSVSEAAALAAAGPRARLLAPRVVSDDHMATCALARGDDT